MIRHIVFDLDGTLVDSAVQCAAIVTAMQRARGVADGEVTAARWRALAGDGLAPLFWLVSGRAPVRPLKPDPMHLLDVVRRGGCPALFVGDSDIDRHTAQAAGIAFVRMKHGFVWTAFRARQWRTASPRCAAS